MQTYKKRLILYLLFLVSQSNVMPIYRSYETHLSDAVSAATGGSGTSSINGIQSIPQNPSYLAGINDLSLALGFEGVFNANSLLNFPSTRFEYLPQFAFNLPAQSYGSAGLMAFTSFQNHDQAFEYSLYNFEAIYSVKFLNAVFIGLSAGGGMGIVKNTILGGGFVYSISALYKSDYFSTGLLVRPPEILNYPVYNGIYVQERTPTRFQAGFTSYIKDWSLIFELEYIDWKNSQFMENNINVAPKLQRGFVDFLHPHLGVDIPLQWLFSLNVRLGVYTADSFDFKGINSRQILFTSGIRVFAGSNDWKNKLLIDLSYESGFLPSLFWSENHQRESLRFTLGYSI
ncbi:MAG: hypothetical protein OEV78_07610 [Spirochaetia bacterium]|nr:hypothetical protein [Spirochaetia bacterium]